MEKTNWVNAIIAAVMLLTLAALMMGIQLSLQGTKLVVQRADEVRWMWIAIGCRSALWFIAPMSHNGSKTNSQGK